MALPVKRSGQKSGGGYLNGVSGVIESITFKQGKSGEGKKGTWTKYSGVVNIFADGATKSVPQFLDAGFLPPNCTISEDGTRIEGSGKYYLDGDTVFGKFIVSLVTKEADENKLNEEVLGDCRNYDSVAGTRVTFSRIFDFDATIAAGLRKLKIKTVTDENREKVIDAGKRDIKKDGKPVKGNDGKPLRLPLDQLLIAEVLAGPEPTTGKKAAPAKKTATAKPAATKTAAAPPAATDVDEEATDELVKAVLGAAADNTVARPALGSAFTKYALSIPELKTNSAKRESIRKTIISEDYLNGAVERGVLILDGDGKDQTVQLVA